MLPSIKKYSDLAKECYWGFYDIPIKLKGITFKFNYIVIGPKNFTLNSIIKQFGHKASLYIQLYTS